LRSEFARWRSLFAFWSITSAVSSLTVSTVPTVSTATSTTKRLALTLALTTHHSTRRCVRSLLLDVGSWDNLSGKVKPFTKIIEALWCEGVVVVLP
jgi:hypothetical protein